MPRLRECNPGDSFLDRMIALVEGAKRQKTPNEVALDILLIGLTLIFLLVVATLQPFARYAGGDLPLVYLAALLVTLITSWTMFTLFSPFSASALILGNNLFRNNLAGIGRVNGQQVQRRNAFLVNELRLRRVRGRQRTIRITDGHLRQVEFGTECRRVCQPRRALIGQNGKIFCGHAFTLRLSIKWMAEAG